MNTIRVETDRRGVRTITFARPEARNALSAEMLDELTAAARGVDDAVRCVVLRGDGPSFCAGADLEEMIASAGKPPAENRADAARFAGALGALDDIAAPLIARVHGNALAGGAGIAALADLVIASPDAVFGFSETRLGLVAATVSPYVVRRVGLRATALFASALRFDAVRSKEIGLVDLIGDDATVEEWVAAICAGSPAAVRGAKRLVRDVAGHTAAEVRDLTIDALAKARASDDGVEGLRAFLEKREPRWRA